MGKKVLLMGRSGSGKTSMRTIIFKNRVAQDTRRLGATIDVEQDQVRFLGELRLDLWDCGGQESYMDSFLASQQNSIFRQVHTLIYIFDVESPDISTDMNYFNDCLHALAANSLRSPASSLDATALSPDAPPTMPYVYVLIHKMDLVPEDRRSSVFDALAGQTRHKCKGAGWPDVEVFATSIWDESLYRAWSAMVSTLIPNLSAISASLSHLADIVPAAEVVLFDRTTFIVVSRKTDDVQERRHAWDPARFDKISQIVKTFRLECQRLSLANFSSLQIRHQSYSAVLDALTSNTYIMVISTDPSVYPAGIQLDIQMSRPHFERIKGLTSGEGQ